MAEADQVVRTARRRLGVISRGEAPPDARESSPTEAVSTDLTPPAGLTLESQTQQNDLF
jgi:hypothetical protein